MTLEAGGKTPEDKRPRRLRADAQRNVAALLTAAKSVFAASGVDAPGQEIADRAGVGIGTMYRHFPRRSDLVSAVMKNEIDACADAAHALAGQNEPGRALDLWIIELTRLVGTKQGLAAALHSNDPSLLNLAGYVRERLEPALETLLKAARVTGQVRLDVTAKEVINAVSLLCHPIPGEDFSHNERMISVFADGLRHPDAPRS